VDDIDIVRPLVEAHEFRQEFISFVEPLHDHFMSRTVKRLGESQNKDIGATLGTNGRDPNSQLVPFTLIDHYGQNR
jgi:hypothetical protein